MFKYPWDAFVVSSQDVSTAFEKGNSPSGHSLQDMIFCFFTLRLSNSVS